MAFNKQFDSPTPDKAPAAPVRIDGFKAGVNNIDPSYTIPPDALRDAVNVDVLNSGKLRSRKGTTRIYNGTTHSAWSDGKIALFVEAGALKKLNLDYTADVIDPLVGSHPMQYLSLNDQIFYANGAASGKIVGGSRREWGVECPNSTPTAVQGAGAMSSAYYQIICTYVNIYGEESGCLHTRTVNISGGMTVSFPQPASSEVSGINFYMSPPNGDQLFFVATVALGNTLTLVEEPVYLRTLKSQFGARMIAGELIEYYRGIIYAAVGNIVWYSDPFNYGLYRPSTNYLSFSSEVTVLRAVQNGLYVVSDTTWYLGGKSPEDFEAQPSMPYGATKYSGIDMKDSQSVIWRSHRGIVRGDDGGAITNLQENRVFPEQTTRGATMIREEDSLKQIISVGINAPHPSSLVASDFWDAEIIRQRS